MNSVEEPEACKEVHQHVSAEGDLEVTPVTEGTGSRTSAPHKYLRLHNFQQ